MNNADWKKEVETRIGRLEIQINNIVSSLKQTIEAVSVVTDGMKKLQGQISRMKSNDMKLGTKAADHSKELNKFMYADNSLNENQKVDVVASNK